MLPMTGDRVLPPPPVYGQGSGVVDGYDQASLTTAHPRAPMNGHSSVASPASWLARGLLWPILGVLLARGAEVPPRVAHDPAHQTITIADSPRDLTLRLRYDARCVLDQVRVGGRNVVATNSGAWTGVKVGGQWYTTRQNMGTPKVSTTEDTATISGILCSGGGTQFKETWNFTAGEDRILWRIEREYLNGGLVEDVGFAGWDFAGMSTWTGALLGQGGVAWCKLFDQPNATYGVHAGEVTLWNRGEPACLRITPGNPAGGHVATRFSRQPDGVFSLTHALSGDRLMPQHGQARFLRDRQDGWAPWTVRPGAVVTEYTLQALDYQRAYDRGTFAFFNGSSIREILNTIARIGAIDDEVMGSNGYYSGYAVLHEPWIAQLGLAIDDPAYFQAYARTLDHQRDHAVGPDGRVKSRWSYTAGDARPGTYDAYGYYECQWGQLMDSQPSYVINVAEQFDHTGDLDWLRRHKESAERAIEFLLLRDADGDGLVEMEAESHRTGKGSDWIDVIWAAHENAFVNAQLYQALRLWADVEEVLGDDLRARDYGRGAALLRTRFNAPASAGGFWSDAGRRFVHWRDRDDSIHGENLVVPVNFMAIAYGLCEPAERAQAVLDQVEARMQAEGLFFWPLCLDSYREGEGAAWQFPFPVYENGDIFLAWGETGTRAYAAYNPSLAVKYIKRVLDQYERDGLAFQRYLRKTQRGAGDDILANNCSPLVGLYRNIYGLQPKWNRLYLEPHLTPDLDGTVLKYWLRGQVYEVALRVGDYRIAVDGFALRSRTPFAVGVGGDHARYFHGQSPKPSLTLRRSGGSPVEVSIQSWSDDPAVGRSWAVAAGTAGAVPEQTLCLLAPDTDFRLSRDGATEGLLRSDANGELILRQEEEGMRLRSFELQPVGAPR